ncbi:hypothetical protein [Schlesneria paludicola]|uniref:hypothetical protein n=1 Tax=Schlesneria paludicola TaxID=360056 RepID=UPI0002E36C94|nr:hypothetical protein [Schlesneria paludicola]
MLHLNRRKVLKSAAAAGLGAMVPGALLWPIRAMAKEAEPLPVAGVITEYRTASHADVILGKILEGYRQDGGPGPGLKLVSVFTDQFAAKDLCRPLAQKYGFRLASSIDDAVTLGTNEVQVAGVLSVGEHGIYPYTPDTKQHMYPRKRFFDEIVATFRRCGKAVPVFNDKHLSYRWDEALAMYETARAMNFPFLAGSSVPLAWRQPVLDLPLGCEIEAAVGVGYGGLEAYGYHALEALQSLIERRRGGETGVSSVQAVQGDGIQQAEHDGRWSRELFEAALKVLPGAPKDNDTWRNNPNSAAYLVEHRDGLKSATLIAEGLASQFAAAVKLKGRPEPLATLFALQPGPPYGHFAYLVDAFEQTIRTGRAVSPVERTLLTTGVLDRAMHSLAESHQRFETPELNVAYQPGDWPFANHPKSHLILPNN